MNTDLRDEELWKLAKKRANFQRSLVSYLITNAFLWVIWWFTETRHQREHNNVPWPSWVMLAWGVALAFQYLNAYGGNKENLIDKEYEKLKNEKDSKK